MQAGGRSIRSELSECLFPATQAGRNPAMVREAIEWCASKGVTPSNLESMSLLMQLSASSS